MSNDEEVIMTIKGPSGRMLRIFETDMQRHKDVQHQAIEEFMKEENQWLKLQEQTQ